MWIFHILLVGFPVLSQLSFGFPNGSPRTGGETSVDLSYPFDASTIYWPEEESKYGFNLTSIADFTNEAGIHIRAKKFQAREHGGTHLDAPSHFNANGLDVAKLSLDQLIGPAVIIDVSSKARQNPDYQVTLDDVSNWEKRYGPIPNGAFVFMLSGWGLRWPDKKAVFGTERPDDPSTFHFPGFHPNTSGFLSSQRNIKGLGVDTPSTDSGKSTGSGTHVALASQNRVGLENVANLDKLPASGATVYVLPMKIENGSGAPVRIVGIF